MMPIPFDGSGSDASDMYVGGIVRSSTVTTMA